MARLSFIHAADLHLDSPFRGIRSEAPEGVAKELREATFRAYENIISLCISEGVDALLVAGDIYDGADRSLRAQLRFVDGLNRLERSGIRSFVCHGNHDPLDGWEARLSLPPGSVRFGPGVSGEPVFPDAPERATVHGISYPQRVVTDNLSAHFPAASATGFNVGLLHANVGGNTGHDNYSPCTVDDLSTTGMDYWALGHVHTRQVLRQSHPMVAYPGNPQGRNPRETGERGVFLVQVDDFGAVSMEFRPVDVVRWEFVEVNISGMETEQELLDGIDGALDACLESASGRSVVCRLVLRGRGPLHGWLRKEGTITQLQEEGINQRNSHAGAWLWCERIVLDTGSPVDRLRAAEREDFVGDLVRLTATVREEGDGLDGLRDLLRPLYVNSNAAPYLRQRLPSDDEVRDLLNLAEAACLDSLAEGDTGE